MLDRDTLEVAEAKPYICMPNLGGGISSVGHAEVISALFEKGCAKMHVLWRSAEANRVGIKTGRMLV